VARPSRGSGSGSHSFRDLARIPIGAVRAREPYVRNT
jgi:hypothetical protein